MLFFFLQKAEQLDWSHFGRPPAAVRFHILGMIKEQTHTGSKYLDHHLAILDNDLKNRAKHLFIYLFLLVLIYLFIGLFLFIYSF